MINYDKITGYLVNFVRKTWDWKGLHPKGWEKRDEIMEDPAQMAKIREELKEFNGPDTSTAGSFGAHVRLSLHQVAYDNDEQGRDPLKMLVSSCISYGMVIVDEQMSRKREAEKVKRQEVFEESAKLMARYYAAMPTPLTVEAIQERADEMYASFMQSFKCAEMCSDVPLYRIAAIEENPEKVAIQDAKDAALIDDIIDSAIEAKRAENG